MYMAHIRHERYSTTNSVQGQTCKGVVLFSSLQSSEIDPVSRTSRLMRDVTSDASVRNMADPCSEIHVSETAWADTASQGRFRVTCRMLDMIYSSTLDMSDHCG